MQLTLDDATVVTGEVLRIPIVGLRAVRNASVSDSLDDVLADGLRVDDAFGPTGRSTLA